MLYDFGKVGILYVYDFYVDEYWLNIYIKCYVKFYIVFIDGIMMGGGVGVFVYGLYCVVGDKIVFVMLEIGIGFFLDVGGSYFFFCLDGEMGMFLGFIGSCLKIVDSVYVGIVIYYVFSEC